MSGPVEHLMQGLAELYESGKLSDFEISCGHYTFSVHKAVLCAQSKYFHAPCGREYAEGQRGSIKLKAVGECDSDEACDDPEAIKLMIQYFYHLHYDAKPLELTPVVDKTDESNEEYLAERLATDDRVHDPWSSGGLSSKKHKNWCKHCGRKGLEGDHISDETHTTATSRSATNACKSLDGNMVMHAKVFAAAVKYQVPALQKLATSKFRRAAKINWNDSSFAEATRIAYTTTPEDLRDIRDTVVKTISEHPTLLQRTSIESAVKDIAALNFELLRKAYGLSAVAEVKDVHERLDSVECE
ncbi:hypothetical protein LTR12_016998 [Friedmanniomyces endolithicus]|nr:hypothetical protein LTR12_016998 [Friedmanniomyces endolithicus]